MNLKIVRGGGGYLVRKGRYIYIYIYITTATSDIQENQMYTGGIFEQLIFAVFAKMGQKSLRYQVKFKCISGRMWAKFA